MQIENVAEERLKTETEVMQKALDVYAQTRHSPSFEFSWNIFAYDFVFPYYIHYTWKGNIKIALT